MSDVRPALTDEDHWYEETMQYFWFAERFGWTPEQVDNMPLRVVDRLPGVAAMHDEMRAEKQRAEAEAARTER